jgi:hypothetical protein
MQPELINLCKENGLSEAGRKEELVETVMEHFAAMNPEEDFTEEKAVTLNQSAIAVRPVRKAALAKDDDIKQLSMRVAALDEAIQNRTQELQALREGDQYAPNSPNSSSVRT